MKWVLMVTFSVSVISANALAEGLCRQLRDKQKELLRGILALKETQAQLNAEFTTAVEEDLQAQAEKIWQQWHRDKATKVAAAKRKIEKKIEEESEKAEGLDKIIAKKCKDAESNP